MTILLQIVIGVLILGILVIIHELGHFAVAKSLGIRVLAFSIGFGRPLYKKTKGETEYRIGSIPFGGYVLMAGEHPEEDQPIRPGDFNSKPTWQRALVGIAGPAANFLSAMLFLWIMYMIGEQEPLYLRRPVVGAVADSSAARTAGFLPGDSIVSIAGKPVASWRDIERVLSSQILGCKVEVARGTQILTFDLNLPKIEGGGLPKHFDGGLSPALPAVIGSVNPGSAGQKAGLHERDSIVSVNGLPIHSWYEFSDMVVHYRPPEGPLSIRVQRGKAQADVSVVPEFNKQADRFLVGISIAEPPTIKVRYSAVGAVPKMLDKTWEFTIMIFDVLKKLISTQVSPQQLAGPVGIIQMSGVVAMGGLGPILGFMALIGINLAVLNCLPLVITDGGLLLFLLIESIRRKPLSIKHQMLINRIAISFFIAFFIYVTYNDLWRIPELLRMGR